ncbi:hypothetical protein ACWCXH_11605 [Kitasatospora sp. NPDC001660]
MGPATPTAAPASPAPPPLGSAFFHPDSPAARAAACHLVRVQADAGGDALVGRPLHPLLTAAGSSDVTVRPRTVHADASRPSLVTSFKAVGVRP